MTTALLPALVLGLTACQGAPDPGAPAARDAKDRPAAAAPAVAAFGDAADAGGNRSGEHLRMSLRGLVDPAIGAPSAARHAKRPAPGTRWVGVDLAVVNVGGTAYESPVTTAWVVDEKGRRHPAVPGGELTTGLPLAEGRLTVGEHREGWLVFEVPHGSRAVRLHCAIGSAEYRWAL